MNELYQRNQFYIPTSDQERVKLYNVFLAGCGIGSNIAECALRLGFESQTLIDGDLIELSNLNRQNYTSDQIQYPKSLSLRDRLLSINPNSKIRSEEIFLDSDNIANYLEGHDVAINALDFKSDVPFRFDEQCQKLGIPVLHPYNIGWATMIFVITPDSAGLTYISDEFDGFEKKVAAFLIENISGDAKSWVTDVLRQYEVNGKGQSPPQLSVGSWLAAGACTNILYKLATGKHVKVFPDFYFLTAG